ncbi:MAG: hypothetical protein ACQKBY_11190 [Verrucomicrobiales bacterium]
MARRAKDNEGGVNLFPFMSILACLIGILTLMISVIMQVKQMDREGRTEEEMARAVANQSLKKEAVKLEAELEEARKKLEKEKKTVAEMAKIEEAKIALRMKLEELEKAKNPEETDAELQKLIENLKKEIAALKRERPPLDKRLAELQAELKKRKEAPKPEQSVIVKPGGVGVKEAENIFFVECNSTGIILLPENGEPTTISTAAIETNEDYHQFLENVKRTRDSMILFLVRKAGNTSYLWAAGFAETKYEVTHGKLPIPNDGKIDLSLFR